MSVEERLVAARVAYEKAARRLVGDASKRAFPEGTDVEIQRGNGTVRGTVVGHGSWWYRPDSLLVERHSTGRTVRVTP